MPECAPKNPLAPALAQGNPASMTNTKAIIDAIIMDARPEDQKSPEVKKSRGGVMAFQLN